MRLPCVTLIAVFLAGCASAPAPDKAAFYVRKYNTYTYGAGPQAESADTSRGATRPANAQPGWYRFGHP